MTLTIDADRDLGREFRFVREIPGHPLGSAVHPTVHRDQVRAWLHAGFIEPVTAGKRRRKRGDKAA